MGAPSCPLPTERDNFDGLDLNHIPRQLNEAADTVAKMASGREPIPTGIFANNQYKPSIRFKEAEEANTEPPDPGLGASQPLAPSDPKVTESDGEPEAEPDPSAVWRMPYLDYLVREVLLTDKTEARQLARRARYFIIIEGKLYKWSHTMILQRCILIN